MDTKELEKRISTTNTAGLIAMLFERLIENFNSCKVAIDNNNNEELNEIINHSRAILTEFLVQFSESDEISLTLREVNVYINKLMTEGQIKKDKSIFDICIDVLTPVCQGFQELETKEKPKAVTGITYGKNDLNEYTLKGNKSFKG